MSVYVTTQATVESEQGSLDLARIGYNNLARDATVTSSSEVANYPADNAQRPDTYEAWQPSALSAWWQADLGSAQSVNYFGIASHSLGTNGCAIKAQYSSDGSTWTDASDAASPSDDTAVMLLFPAQSKRYWRLYVDTAGSPSGTAPSIAVIYLGAVTVMERMLYGGHVPITLSRDTVLQQSLSNGGHFLGQSYRRHGFTTSIAYKHLTASFIRNTFDPFVQAARQYPYFFAWKPSDWANEIVYGWTPNDIRPVNMGVSGLMSVSWPIRAFSDS